MKIKKFFSRTILLMGVLVGMLLPTHFSVAQSYQNYDNLTISDLLETVINFIMPNYTVHLHATTAPNTYTIYFNGNGNDAGTMGSLPMTYDQTGVLLTNNFTRNGYAFLGWSTGASLPVIYTDEQSVINLTSEDSGHVTLYAQREKLIAYTVNYYQENITGTGYDLVISGVFYDLVDTGTMFGRADTQVPPTDVSYTGFTLQTGDPISINPDGSTVVPYYYDRNIYHVTVKDRDTVLLDTGMKYGEDIPLPVGLIWAGNTFSGWTYEGTVPDHELEINSIWIYGKHSVRFDTDGGSAIAPIEGNYGDSIPKPANPTKDGYVFVGWSPEFPITIYGDDIIVTAIWKKSDDNKSTGWSGRGGRGSNTQTENEHGSANTQTGQQHGTAAAISGIKVDMEEIIAYRWAYKNGIIDDSWADAYPNGYLTRGDMAEMVVRFATNILGRNIPDEYPRKCTWDDPANSRWGPDAESYANKACRLGIMGMWMKEFMPNKAVDRAEFGTVLSRLLRGHMYDVVNPSDTNPYYVKHLDALNKEGIMKNIEDPTNTMERRKWVWIMMMRTSQKMPHG